MSARPTTAKAMLGSQAASQEAWLAGVAGGEHSRDVAEACLGCATEAVVGQKLASKDLVRGIAVARLCAQPVNGKTQFGGRDL